MRFKPSYCLDVLNEESYLQEMQNITHILDEYKVSGYMESFDQNKIYYEYYLAENPKASVVIVHGFKEFAKKYTEICWYFLQMGYNVFLYDQRGHGFSYRENDLIHVVHINEFSDYTKDLDMLIQKIVQPNSPDLPIYLYGHSMGGAVAMFYIAQANSVALKTVLAAPMIYPECISLPRQILRVLIKRRAQKVGWDTGSKVTEDFDPEQCYAQSSELSDCRFNYTQGLRMNEPKYQHVCSSNRWNYEALGLIKTLLSKKKIAEVKSDVLMITAGQDVVVKRKPQKIYAKRMGCAYKCFKTAKHSLHAQKTEELSEYLNEVFAFYEQ